MSAATPGALCQFIHPLEVAKKQKAFFLLDVRSPIEFESEHIEGSKCLPLADLESKVDELPRDEELLVVCRSGKRAERAAYALMSRGLHPKVLSGGLDAWKKAGLPVEEGRKMISIERQIQLVVGIGVLSGLLLGTLVSPWFLFIPGFFGAGLTFAGLSGTCALGILLGKAPWNRLEHPGEGKPTNCCK